MIPPGIELGPPHLKAGPLPTTPRTMLVYLGVRRVYIEGHWPPYEVIFYDYDGQGAKDDWGFRISDLIKNPDGSDI